MIILVGASATGKSVIAKQLFDKYNIKKVGYYYGKQKKLKRNRYKKL